MTLVLGSALQDFHEGFAWFMVIGNGIAGLWAGAAHWVTSLRSRAVWWFTGIVEVAVFVQVIMGVILVAGEDIDPPQFHMFYGFVAIIAVGIIYSYRQQMEQYRYLLYGGGGLFLMGLGIGDQIDGNEPVAALLGF